MSPMREPMINIGVIELRQYQLQRRRPTSKASVWAGPMPTIVRVARSPDFWTAPATDRHPASRGVGRRIGDRQLKRR
jgi:hypothetical protein